MRTPSTVSALLAALLFAAPVLAQTAPPAPGPAPAVEQPRGRWGHAGKRGRGKGMSRRFDRAVEQGRLSRAQADQFKAEAQQLHEERRALRASNGGTLTLEQKAQFKQRRQVLREKVRAAMGVPPRQGA